MTGVWLDALPLLSIYCFAFVRQCVSLWKTAQGWEWVLEILTLPMIRDNDPYFSGQTDKSYMENVWLLLDTKRESYTAKPVFKTTWEIGTAWKLRTATPVPRPIEYIEIDLRTKTTLEFRTVFHSPLGVPNSQVPLYRESAVLLDWTLVDFERSSSMSLISRSLITQNIPCSGVADRVPLNG